MPSKELYVRWLQPSGIIVEENIRERAPGDEDLLPEGEARAYEKVGLVEVLNEKRIQKLGAKP